MFTELMPLIEQRPLTITVAVFSGGRQIRVNVVPQDLEKDGRVNDKVGYSNKDKIAKVPDEAIKALTTPLSLTGTAEEIDAELAQALREFAESHVQLQKTVDPLPWTRLLFIMLIAVCMLALAARITNKQDF